MWIFNAFRKSALVSALIPFSSSLGGDGECGLGFGKSFCKLKFTSNCRAGLLDS